MGQSMSTPNSPRLNQNKPSLRSLQRTSRSSVNQQLQSSQTNKNCDRQKLRKDKNQLYNSENINKRVQFPGKYQSNYTLKTYRSTGRLKQQLNNDDQIYSPNFKQIPQEEEINDVHEFKEIIQQKIIQKSNSQSRHDMTISFSKTKNPNTNPTQEQTFISKENLSKILQNQEFSLNQVENEINISNNDFSAYLHQLSIKQINKQFGQEQNNPKIIATQQKIRKQTNKFNDYDQQIKQENKIRNRQVKLSPKLIEVKQKIINVSNYLQSKNSLFKSISRHNSSQNSRSLRVQESMRKNNDGLSIGNKVENLQESSHFSKKNYENKQQINDRKMFESNSTEFSKKSLPVSSINQPKDDKTKHKSSKLLIFNGSDAYVYAKNRIDGNKQMNSKHFKKDNRKCNDNQIHCQKEKKSYVPTQAQEYDLLGIISPRKLKATNRKIQESIKNTFNETKFLTKKPQIIQNPQPNNELKFHHQQKKPNPLLIKPKDPNTKKRREQQVEAKKRYKSQQNKNLLNSKLLVF